MKEEFASILVGIIVLLAGFTVFINEPQGAAVKGSVIKLEGPKQWVERRYICDLPNRQDCIRCCNEIKKYTRGPTVLIDYESCVAKMPKKFVTETKKIWEDCIRQAAGLQPKYGYEFGVWS